MISTGIVFDGLWRCLCPLVDAALARVLYAPSLGTAAAARSPQRRAAHGAGTLGASHLPHCRQKLPGHIPCRHPSSARCFSSEAAPASPSIQPPPPRLPSDAATPAANDDGYILLDPMAVKLNQDLLPQKEWKGLARDMNLRRNKYSGLNRGRLHKDMYIRVRHDVAHGFVRRLRDIMPDGLRPAGYLARLLHAAGYKSDPLVAEVLLRAQCFPQGSAAAVRDILWDMEEAAGYKPPASVYHGALRALAVHPDYILRNQILERMRRDWIDLRPEGHESVVLAMLREGQYELAMDKLDQIVSEDIAISSWVYDVFIYAFAELGFHDEVFRIISHRLGRNGGASKWPSSNMWYFLLDSSSSAMHYEGTKYVWNRSVPHVLNPPDGVVNNVLNTAVRGSDASLAAQAIRMLAERGNKLGLQHYEPLVDCYAGAGDLEKAMSVLCIMEKAGARPSAGSTRSIFATLRRKEPPELIGAAKMLFRLQDQQDVVPIAAFNVVLEAMMDKNMVGKAMDLYKQVRRAVDSGPELSTFNMMLRMHVKRLRGTAEMAKFLMAEMAALGIKFNLETYNLVISIRVRAGELRAAVQLLDEMSDLLDDGPVDWKGWLKQTTFMELVQLCVEKGDKESLHHVVRLMMARGLQHGLQDRDWEDIQSAMRDADTDQGSEVSEETAQRDSVDTSGRESQLAAADGERDGS